ncbi:hypothetical protein SDC9_88993 [bioreactor metagenome]|uniref:Lipoprotein n=1 Tax=bioreactor metagenome TaxID=1076179 RepID=A0A644ZPL5_9ZZZZ
MKKTRNLIIGIVVLFIAAAGCKENPTEQKVNTIDSTPIFDKHSNWIMLTTNPIDSSYRKTTKFALDGDTMFHGKTYMKIFRDGIFYAGLRETKEHKIYVYFPDDPIADELLTYDFDWYKGKALKYQMRFADYQDTIGWPYCVIAKIDSIKLLDNKYYKCLKDTNEEMFCVQGIGDLKDFFHINVLCYPKNGDQRTLLRFYKGEQLIYSNPKYTE